jgi:CDP-4-dehydro-6-deoxyglucose reductase
MPPNWFEGTLLHTIDETSQVRRFWIDPGQPLLFKPGQFITADLPVGEKRWQRWRSYSIASAPEDGNILELCIVRNPAGTTTNFLFDQFTLGDKLKLKGPEGNFILPSENRTLVLICTGTGIAPFRSMLRQLKNQTHAYPKVHLIFGTRMESDILYRSEMENLALTHPWFKYDIALSKQPDWPGYNGHVHQIYLDHYAGKTANAVFMICGWSAMIDEAHRLLQEKLGCRPEQVIFERYG